MEIGKRGLMRALAQVIFVLYVCLNLESESEKLVGIWKQSGKLVGGGGIELQINFPRSSQGEVENQSFQQVEVRSPIFPTSRGEKPDLSNKRR